MGPYYELKVGDYVLVSDGRDQYEGFVVDFAQRSHEGLPDYIKVGRSKGLFGRIKADWVYSHNTYLIRKNPVEADESPENGQCPRCGKYYDKGQAYCEECGKDFPQTP